MTNKFCLVRIRGKDEPFICRINEIYRQNPKTCMYDVPCTEERIVGAKYGVRETLRIKTCRTGHPNMYERVTIIRFAESIEELQACTTSETRPLGRGYRKVNVKSLIHTPDVRNSCRKKKMKTEIKAKKREVARVVAGDAASKKRRTNEASSRETCDQEILATSKVSCTDERNDTCIAKRFFAGEEWKATPDDSEPIASSTPKSCGGKRCSMAVGSQEASLNDISEIVGREYDIEMEPVPNVPEVQKVENVLNVPDKPSCNSERHEHAELGNEEKDEEQNNEVIEEEEFRNDESSVQTASFAETVNFEECGEDMALMDRRESGEPANTTLTDESIQEKNESSRTIENVAPVTDYAIRECSMTTVKSEPLSTETTHTDDSIQDQNESSRTIENVVPVTDYAIRECSMTTVKSEPLSTETALANVSLSSEVRTDRIHHPRVTSLIRVPASGRLFNDCAKILQSTVMMVKDSIKVKDHLPKASSPRIQKHESDEDETDNGEPDNERIAMQNEVTSSSESISPERWSSRKTRFQCGLADRSPKQMELSKIRATCRRRLGSEEYTDGVDSLTSTNSVPSVSASREVIDMRTKELRNELNLDKDDYEERLRNIIRAEMQEIRNDLKTIMIANATQTPAADVVPENVPSPDDDGKVTVMENIRIDREFLIEATFASSMQLRAKKLIHVLTTHEERLNFTLDRRTNSNRTQVPAKLLDTLSVLCLHLQRYNLLQCTEKNDPRRNMRHWMSAKLKDYRYDNEATNKNRKIALNRKKRQRLGTSGTAKENVASASATCSADMDLTDGKKTTNQPKYTKKCTSTKSVGVRKAAELRNGKNYEEREKTMATAVAAAQLPETSEIITFMEPSMYKGEEHDRTIHVQVMYRSIDLQRKTKLNDDEYKELITENCAIQIKGNIRLVDFTFETSIILDVYKQVRLAHGTCEVFRQADVDPILTQTPNVCEEFLAYILHKYVTPIKDQRSDYDKECLYRFDEVRILKTAIFDYFRNKDMVYLDDLTAHLKLYSTNGIPTVILMRTCM